MRRYILDGWHRQACPESGSKPDSSAGRSLARPCENTQINTRTMTVKKQVTNQTKSRESSLSSGKSDAEHDRTGMYLILRKLLRCIAELNHTVNARRIAGKLFDLESQLRILDQPGTKARTPNNPPTTLTFVETRFTVVSSKFLAIATRQQNCPPETDLTHLKDFSDENLCT